MQLGFELFNMWNTFVELPSTPFKIHSDLYLLLHDWKCLKHCKMLMQSNVMVFVTSFLLCACNLDFSNMLSDLAVTSVFFLCNFLIYRNVMWYLLDSSTVTSYFCNFVILSTKLEKPHNTQSIVGGHSHYHYVCNLMVLKTKFSRAIK